MKFKSSQSVKTLAAIASVSIGLGAGSAQFSRADGDGEPAAVAEQFEAGEPADPKQPFRVVEVTMTEANGGMAFAPAEVNVKKNEQIKFIIKNAGALDHEFKLDSVEQIAKHKIAMEKNPEMEHDGPNGIRLQPSKSGEIFWKFSKAGSFEFACLIPGHYQGGMHGNVVVK